MSAGIGALLILFISGLGYYTQRSIPFRLYVLRSMTPQEMAITSFFHGLAVIVVGVLSIAMFLKVTEHLFDFSGTELKEYLKSVDLMPGFWSATWNEIINSNVQFIVFYSYCFCLVFLFGKFNVARSSLSSLEGGMFRKHKELYKKHGSEFELLVLDSLYSLYYAEYSGEPDELVLLIITLENDKVYVGYPLDLSPDREFKQIVIMPMLSGFRDGNDKKVYFTQDYSNLFIYESESNSYDEKKPDSSEEEATGSDKTENERSEDPTDLEDDIQKLQICIPVERIVTMSSYDLSYAEESISNSPSNQQSI